MARILIDGYNLLPATALKDRDRLIARLGRYQKEKGHRITIVFDGTKGGTGTGDRYHEAGVEVVFTALTVTADDLIEELLRRSDASRFIVVSSDRRIQSAAKRARAAFLGSDEFARRMVQTGRADSGLKTPPWLEGRDEATDPDRRIKKGSPKKLPKDERARRRRTEKV
jgi:predicted RNA-binding protein with PIN domain